MNGPPQPQESLNFMLKITQQIQSDIQNLLQALPTQQATQLSPRSLSHSIQNTRKLITRALSLGLPKIVAVQEKYKSVVVSVGEELEIQKAKTKDYAGKYESKVLECDKYKMETIHYIQIYESLFKDKVQLELLVDEMQKQINNTQIDALKQIKTYTDIDIQTEHEDEQVEEMVLQHKEQKELFLEELTKLNEEISEYKKHQLASNERIQQLLEQLKLSREMWNQEKESNLLIKEELSKAIIELEQQKIENEQKANQNDELLEDKKQAEALIESNVQCIRELNLNCKQRSDEVNRCKEMIEEKNTRISELEAKVQETKSLLQGMHAKQHKMTETVRNQQILQKKYVVKMELVEKHNKQLDQKVKYYKNENDRLYLAMDQFAAKQSKLISKIQQYQQKIQAQTKALQKGLNSRKDLSRKLESVTKQICFATKQVNKQIVLQIIRQTKQQMQEIQDQLLSTFSTKLKELKNSYSSENGTLASQLQSTQACLKLLQKNYLQSQQSHSKLHSSLMQQKSALASKLSESQQIIKGLHMELTKQRAISIEVVNKVGQAIHNNGPSAQLHFTNSYQNEFELEIESQLQKQRNRFLELQCEYQMMMKE